MTHRVILADHQAIFRTGVARVLGQASDLEIVHQCADLTGLLDAVPAFGSSVVVFPTSLTPHLNELLDAIHLARSRAVLIVEHGTLLEAHLAHRAAGIVSRSVEGAQLLECVRRVASGQRSVQRASAKTLPVPDRVGARVLERLSLRELQIISLVAEGHKNRQVADRLGTKEQVVKNYLRTIYDKTGVSDRLELALFTIHHRTLAEAVQRARAELDLDVRTA